MQCENDLYEESVRKVRGARCYSRDDLENAS